MLKNVAIVIALIGLVIWGVYDLDFTNDAAEEKTKEENAAPVGVLEGYAAPDFELQTLSGDTMKLSDLRGKRVIVNLWATWCPPCRAEMPDMQSFYEANQNDDVVILGVNVTSTESKIEDVNRFVEQFNLTFPIVLDEQNAVADRYQVASLPTSFMIDSKGIIQTKIIGPMNLEMMEQFVYNME